MSQDFSGQNLRGRSFRGQNLEGADFSNADIRSADFTGTNLRGANFTGAKAGLQKRWALFLAIISLLLSAVSLIFAILGGIYAGLMIADSYLFGGVFNLTVLLAFFIITIRNGLRTALVFLAVILVGAIAVSVKLPGYAPASTGLLVLPMSIALAMTGVVAGLAIAAVQAIVTGVLAVLSAVAYTMVIVVVLSLHLSEPTASIPPLPFMEVLGVVAGVVAVVSQSAYVAWQALVGNEKQSLVRAIAVAFGAIGGTSFRSADLTDTNFQKASLKNTDFRKSNMTRTFWFKTKKLSFARVGTSYLEKWQVRQLLITREGQDKNFDHQNLRGINFKGANLVDASFISADLSEACLQDGNLSRAKLVQTQLDGTDFTGAILTGAYIEDWNITNETNFPGVRCEYVYMRFPTKENPDPWRKPDNREEVFADGEFGDFIKPLVDTLDLYHNQGVDPRAIAIAYKQLAENNPDAELEIVAMEKRGRDKFLLRAKTAQEADKSQLSGEYFETYNYLKSLPPSEQIKHFLTELKVKDTQINYQENHISRLETMISTALERPSLQAENIYSRGAIMSQSSKKESHFDLKGAQFAGGLVDAYTVNAEQIGGDTTNYGQEQKQKETNNSVVKTILILASNPKDTSPLRLDEEVREIDTGLQRASKRELFDLKQRWAVRLQDVYQALLDFKPQIVHFSGHGSGDDGLALEDEAGNLQLVDTEALTKLFELFSSRIECVVLNACYSEVQAQAIAKYIPYVIGMNQAIGDKAAVKFATGFYNALGAGESVEFAYKLGCSIIQLEGIAENFTPVLKKK